MAEEKMLMKNYLKSLGREVIPYGNASHALRDILVYLSAKRRIARPNIVLPAYIPAKLYRAIAAAGYQPRFYAIKDECMFDCDEIDMLIDNETTAIFGIHYFGHPTDIIGLREIADRKKIKLIEDCAHVLIGSTKGRPLGTFGDFAIFSPRKMLQLPSGGFLVSKESLDNFSRSSVKRANTISTASKFLGTRLKRVYYKFTGCKDIFHLERLPKIGHFDPSREASIFVKKMSPVTSAYLKVTDIRRHSFIRKQNYNYLLDRLASLEIMKPLFNDRPKDWEPYSLPMLVLVGDRIELQKRLMNSGISTGLGWPESPFGNKDRKTRNLSQQLIELPVHPLMLKGQLNNIVETCVRFEQDVIRYQNSHGVPVATNE
jgi:dTDP-4-amino-4,6-dideoxygalactose transaminase